MLRRPAQVMALLTTSSNRSRATAAATILVGFALGGCAGGPGSPLDLTEAAPQTQLADASAPKSELQKATEYWGKQVEKNPADAQAALNYARNLKALGAKDQAVAVLHQAHSHNPTHKGVNSEYGRLALETNQIAAAQKLLDQASDPISPDWKTISARGTLLAKQGKHREAIVQFEQARALAPNQSSVLNNLALAHAMDGRAEKAETMLREAQSASPSDERIARNLALVLGLQGKHDEAKTVVAKALPPEDAAEDASFMKQMVKSPSQAAPSSPVASAAPVAKTAQVKGQSSISTASVSKPAPGPAPGKSMAPVADAGALVQKLADGYTQTPPNQPVNLLPKH